MTLLISLSDSEVSSVQAVGDMLCVRLSAATAIRPEDGLEGYARGVELMFHQAHWKGEPGRCFGLLSAGQLALDGMPAPSISVPYRSNLPTTAELVFRQGERLQVEAAAVTIRTVGPLLFNETYAC